MPIEIDHENARSWYLSFFISSLYLRCDLESCKPIQGNIYGNELNILRPIDGCLIGFTNKHGQLSLRPINKALGFMFSAVNYVFKVLPKQPSVLNKILSCNWKWQYQQLKAHGISMICDIKIKQHDVKGKKTKEQTNYVIYSNK